MSRNLMDRLDLFEGTAVDGFLHNWLLSPTFELPGTPMGVTVDVNHSPFGLDMTLFKEILEQLEVKDIGVIAEQGFGKTFAVDQLVTFWAPLDVGKDCKFRFKMHSLKRNNHGRPETAALVEDFYHCKVINPFTAKFNPLSRLFKMTFDEKYRMLIRIYQFDLRRKLTSEERKVLKDVLNTLEWDLDHDPSFPRLAEGFEQYNPPEAAVLDELIAVQDNGTEVLPDQRPRMVSRYVESAPEEQPWMTQRKIEHSERNFTKLYDAAFAMELATKTFNEGEYASILNGSEEDTEETIRLMSQRAVSIDYKLVDADMRSELEIIWSAIDMVAETPWPDDPDGEPRLPELIYNAIITDEAYNAWENPEFVENEYRRMKTRRENGIIGVMIFHRLRDFFQAIGNDATARKARNAINEIKVWLIGRQNKDALDDIRNFFTLPETVIQSLTTLSKGHFYLVCPGLPLMLVVIIGTEMSIELFNTEGAHASLLQQYFETRDTKLYITYLENTTPETEEESEESSDDTDGGEYDGEYSE